MDSLDDALWRNALEQVRIPERHKERLLRAWPDAAGAFRASSAALARQGLDPRQILSLREFRTGPLRAKVAEALDSGARCLPRSSERYPRLLREIPDPPRILWVRGELDPDEECLAVVGSRRASSYGRDVARRLGEELAWIGATVVSGAARGVDGEAHRGALEAQGRTVAVLGCGIDQAYPREHASLLERIVDRGAVITELPPGAPPRSRHFPRRNRILSGLCRAAVVVEGRERSGSLITARLAGEQNREVFAVPHDLWAPDGGGQGPNLLFERDMARVFTGTEDLLAHLPPVALEGLRRQAAERRSDTRSRQHDLEDVEDPEARTVLDALCRRRPRTPEELAERTGLPAPKVLTSLALLELKGRVRRVAGLRYLRRTVK